MKHLMKDAKARCVSIATDHSRGSGIVLFEGVVLTCFHMLETGSRILVDGELAEIAACAPEHDMALLSVQTEKFAPITFAKAVRDQPAFYIGNPGQHVGICVRGFIVDVSKHAIYFDGRVRGGASGSGLYSSAGLVGLVTAIEVRDKIVSFGIAKPSAIIRKFLKEVLQ